MQESFRWASSGLRRTTFDGRKVDATMRTKIILQSRVNWLFRKRAANKNQCALFQSPPRRRLQCHSDRKLKRCEIFGLKFFANQKSTGWAVSLLLAIVRNYKSWSLRSLWREVLSIDFLCWRSKRRQYCPHQLNVDGDELIYSLETLVLYVNFSTYYERRWSIPLWWTVSKTSTNPEDSRKKVKNANDNQSIFQ